MVAFDASGVPERQFASIFASFLLLRWIDLLDAEQEAMAIFEEREFQPTLQSDLQWRSLVRIKDPDELSLQIMSLGYYAEQVREWPDDPRRSWLHLCAEPLMGPRDLASIPLLHFVKWVGELPFETPTERRSVLGLFDEVMSLTFGREMGEYSTPTSVAHLMVALGNPSPSERIYDPCFGMGNLLIESWDWADRKGEGHVVSPALLDVSGIDISRNTFLIGLVRLALAGIDSPHLAIGNSLEREAPTNPSREGYDLILANPPFNVPGKLSPSLGRLYAIPTRDTLGLFIQQVILQLKPNGRAVVLVPEGFLFRGGPERNLRRHLIECGQVDAVISLTAGSFQPTTSIRCALILLNRKGGNQKVRMVEASTLLEPTANRKEVAMSTSAVEQLAAEVLRPEIRTQSEQSTTAIELAVDSFSRTIWEVSNDELADIEWDLTPKWREKGGLEDLLSSLRAAWGDTAPVLALGEVVQISAGRSVSFADLNEGPQREQSVPFIRIGDLAHGKVDKFSRWIKPDAIELHRRGALLPGDVLLSKSGTIAKIAVVRNGAVGAVASSAFFILRPDKSRLDAGFLLAYLSSPSCQNWISAQSRGTVIKHLNRPVLERLFIPLPPLNVQAKAAVAFRELGTDVMSFLVNSGDSKEQDRLLTWLDELDHKLQATFNSSSGTPNLAQFEPFVFLGAQGMALQFAMEERSPLKAPTWIEPLARGLGSLSGAWHIPQGPGLLAILQDAERSFEYVTDLASGHLQSDSHARSVANQFRRWMRAEIDELAEGVGLRLRSAPSELIAGAAAQVTLELENFGPLPIRALAVKTKPDWGSHQQGYLAERSALSLILQGDAPSEGDQFSLHVNWTATCLNGKPVRGDIEVPFHLRKQSVSQDLQIADLGSSPYVTGDPLKPKHGHSLFLGRKTIIDRISRQISEHGNVVLLEGNRRVGKTSILWHLEGQVIPNWLAVYANLQGGEGARGKVGVPTHEIFRLMAYEIARGVSKCGVDTPLPNGELIPAGKLPLGIMNACKTGISEDSPFLDFRVYLEQILSVLTAKNLGLLLMLDEFDKLQEGIDSGVTSPQVPENFRFLIHHYSNFSAILTGSRRLKRLREEYWSALYGIGISIPVTFLDQESAKELVVEPVRSKLTISQEAISRVLELTARHPYLIQCLCNKLFDYSVEIGTRTITLPLVDASARLLVHDNEHFASLWDYAGFARERGSRRRHYLLYIFAKGFKQDERVAFSSMKEQLSQQGVEVPDDELAADLECLRELELIELLGPLGEGEYRLTIPLMADWIEEHQDADIVLSRARLEREEENA
jgi:type I restriction enzyme M protein